MTRPRPRWLAALGLVLLAAVGLVVAGPGANAPVAAAGGGGMFAFLMGDPTIPYSQHLYVAGDDGSGLRRLSGQAAAGRPSYSPDGTKIVFSGPIGDGSTGRYGLYEVGVDGSGLHRLTAPTFADFDPVWSPDGHSIAFTRQLNGKLDPSACCALFVMRADGTGARRLPGTTGGSKPSWSPDSQLLVYDAVDGLRVVNVSGTGGQALIARGDYTDPAWSPDGSRVAFVVRRDAGGSDLAVVSSHGGTPSTLTHLSGQVEDPVWSADSSTLHFVHYAGRGVAGRTGSDVWQVGAAGGSASAAFGYAGDIIDLAYLPPAVAVHRLAGPDRYATAAAIATATFPHAATAVVASGLKFPDGLAAAALAGAQHGPVLLVPPTGTAPAVVRQALDRLGVTQVTVLGGPSSVSAQTAASLGGSGRTVTRIAGAERTETAAKVATAIGADRIGTWGGLRTAFLTRQDVFADALAASAPAAADVLPILLTPSDHLTNPTRDALSTLGIQQVVIVGDDTAVSAQVEQQVTAMGITVRRYAGANRYETAADLAAALVQPAPTGLGFTPTRFAAVSGATFPDALAGGPRAGAYAEPILDVAGNGAVPAATSAYVKAHRSAIVAFDVYGGTPTIPTWTVVALQQPLR